MVALASKVALTYRPVSGGKNGQYLHERFSFPTLIRACIRSGHGRRALGPQLERVLPPETACLEPGCVWSNTGRPRAERERSHPPETQEAHLQHLRFVLELVVLSCVKDLVSVSASTVVDPWRGQWDDEADPPAI